MIELGPRLRAIADFVLPERPFADLCCDHALLAAALVESGRVPWAIAGDVAAAPLAAAARMLDAHELRERVELREGDGLAVLEPGEVATVVIAGVGAALAGRILRAGAATGRLRGVERLIVQPNHSFPGLGRLRACMAELGWVLIDEALVRDQARTYVILVAAPGEPRELDHADRELGPILRRAGGPLYEQWLARERRRISKAVAALARAGQEPDKLAEYRGYLALLE